MPAVSRPQHATVLSVLRPQEWSFAAETIDVAANAVAKLDAKRLDIIVANDVSAPSVGFAHDTNAVTIITADGVSREVTLRSKREVARMVFDEIVAVRNRF